MDLHVQQHDEHRRDQGDQKSTGQKAGWTVNACDPAAPTTITPGGVVTIDPGTADFALSKVVAAGSSTTLTEVQQAGDTLGAVGLYRSGFGSDGVTGSVDVTVKPNQTWTCTLNKTTNQRR